MRKIFVVSTLLVVIAGAYWLSSRASRTAAEVSAVTAGDAGSAPASAASPDSQPASKPAASSNGRSLAPLVAAGAVTRVPSSVAPAASAPSLGLSGVLAKYSSNRSWEIERDPDGRPMRMSGQGLQAMGGGSETNAFLDELGRELGFKVPPVLERRATRTASFEVEDYLQSYRFANGETLPVYDAWLRLKGTQAQGAYVVVNLLKVVDESIRPDSQLSGDEAVAILRHELELKPDATISVRPSPVVFADQAPHQKALQIDVGGPQPHWLVLVGFDTHSVVYKRITSHN